MHCCTKPSLGNCESRMNEAETRAEYIDPAPLSAGSMYSALVSASFIRDSQLPSEGLVQQCILQSVERGEFSCVDAGKALGLIVQFSGMIYDALLDKQVRERDRELPDFSAGQVRNGRTRADLLKRLFHRRRLEEQGKKGTNERTVLSTDHNHRVAVVSLVFFGNDGRMADMPTLNQEHVAGFQHRLLILAIKLIGNERLSIEDQAIVLNMPSKEVGHAGLLIDVPSRPDIAIC